MSVALIIALVVAPFTILTLCFAIEVLAGLKRLPTPPTARARNVSAVIVIPAHDEASVLPSTLPTMLEAARGRARVLLVADNCSDRSADIARELGAEVIERADASLRGKGFALAFAKHHLMAEPPEVVVIVDADCAIDGESVSNLIQACASTGRSCQAINLQRPGSDASAAVQLSTFAFFIKNVVRLRGLQRLSGRAHLLGTGMALPWKSLEEVELATGNIVEDLKLGQELAERGYPPTLIEQATVWSSAESKANTLSQRQRWEGGFLANAVKAGPVALRAGISSADVHRLWSALNLMTPPFALLLMLDLAALAVAAIATWATGAELWPIKMLGASILLASVALGLAWLTGGSRFVTLGSLVRAPLYLAWKLPMYVSFARYGTPKEWRRTGRN